MKGGARQRYRGSTFSLVVYLCGLLVPAPQQALLLSFVAVVVVRHSCEQNSSRRPGPRRDGVLLVAFPKTTDDEPTERSSVLLAGVLPVVGWVDVERGLPARTRT